MRLLIALLLTTSAAHASASSCAAVFSPSQQIITQLVSLRLEAMRATNKSTARALYSEFKTKFVESQNSGVDLSAFAMQLEKAHGAKSESESERTRARERMINREQLALNPWHLADSVRVVSIVQAADVTPDGQKLVYSDVPGNLRWKEIGAPTTGDWLTVEGKPLHTSIDPTGRYALIKTRAHVLIGSLSTVRIETTLIDLASGQHLMKFSKGLPVFSPDGQSLAVVEAEGVVVYDLATLNKKTLLIPSTAGVESLHYSADGFELGAKSAASIEIFEVASGKSKSINFATPVNSLSRDLRTRFSFTDEGGVLTHIDGHTVTVRIPEHQSKLTSLFSHDDRHLAIASTNEILIVETETGYLTDSIPIKGTFQTMRLGSDGRTLLVSLEVNSGEQQINVYHWQEPSK